MATREEGFLRNASFCQRAEDWQAAMLVPREPRAVYLRKSRRRMVFLNPKRVLFAAHGDGRQGQTLGFAQ